MVAEPLVCPKCASTHALDERFCPDCHMPLVYAGALGVDQPVTEQQERARKVKPQYTEGELVRVTTANNQAEADFIAGLLLEEGVPSLQRRARGFDVPDFLAAGPRDIMVPASGVSTAREVLLQSDLAPSAEGSGRDGMDRPLRVLLGLVAALAVVALVAWAGVQLS